MNAFFEWNVALHVCSVDNEWMVTIRLVFYLLPSVTESVYLQVLTVLGQSCSGMCNNNRPWCLWDWRSILKVHFQPSCLFLLDKSQSLICPQWTSRLPGIESTLHLCSSFESHLMVIRGKVCLWGLNCTRLYVKKHLCLQIENRLLHLFS